MTAAALAAGVRRRLDTADSVLALSSERLTVRSAARLDSLDERAFRAGAGLLGASRRSLSTATSREVSAATRFGQRAQRALAATSRDLRAHEARLAAMHPRRALARGWSITRDRQGRVVREPAALVPGDELTTTLAGGTLRSLVADGAGPPPAGGTDA